MSGASDDPRVERTRTEVHAAVLQLLQTEGIAAVTHQRVADVSGISRATVYRHWEDRQALLSDTILALRPNPTDVEQTEELRADLLALVTAGAKQIENRPYLPWLVAMLATETADADLAPVIAAVSSMQGTPILPLLAAAVERGELPQDLDVEVAVATIVGPLFALRFLLRKELTAKRVANVVDVWLRGHLVE